MQRTKWRSAAHVCLGNADGMLGGGSQAGGVAYAAHIGGFIAGLILVKAFAAGRIAR